MLDFILGDRGSGKTTFLVNTVKSALSKNKQTSIYVHLPVPAMYSSFIDRINIHNDMSFNFPTSTLYDTTNKVKFGWDMETVCRDLRGHQFDLMVIDDPFNLLDRRIFELYDLRRSWDMLVTGTPKPNFDIRHLLMHPEVRLRSLTPLTPLAMEYQKERVITYG